MMGRALLWASEKNRVRKFVTEGSLTKNVVRRFVAGDHLDDAISVIKDLNSKGIGGILDLLGEGVQDPAGATRAVDEYLSSIKRISETGVDTTVAVKLTQLGLAFDKEHCLEHVRKLASEAKAAGTIVEIDMEQSEYVDDTLDVYRTLRTEGHDGRVAIQAYLRRTPIDLERLADVGVKVRLVKGAYAEPDDIAFQRGAEIEQQFRYLTEWLFDNGIDPAIASHDEDLIRHATSLALKTSEGRKSFEIQMLYGIRREYQERLAGEGHRMRVYVPYGSDWYPYLMRRMAERPANLRFFMRAVVHN